LTDKHGIRFRQRILSVGPVFLVLAGCFSYSAFQIFTDQIDIEPGDGAKYVNSSLYMQADPLLALTELFNDASAAANDIIYAIAFGLGEKIPWQSPNPNAPALFCNLIASYLVILLGWFYCKENHGPGSALLVVAFLLGNNFVTAHSLNTFAEPFGAVFVLLALLLSGTKERDAKNPWIIASCLLIASLFRHEYFFFGIYLAAPFIWKKQFRKAAPLILLPPLYFLIKSVHQRINGSVATEYQSWLDHPIIGSSGERVSDGFSILLEVITIDFIPFGGIIGGILLALSLWFAWQRRASFPKSPVYLLLCHAAVLLCLWTTGVAPHVQHRYAAILEYLFPLVCVGVVFRLLKGTPIARGWSSRANPETIIPKIIATICILSVSSLSLWAHRAEVYNIRLNRVPLPMLEAKQFLAGNIKTSDNIYFGYAASWGTYFQNHCYHKGQLGNSYAYSNEFFYGHVPIALISDQERSETTTAIYQTSHRDLIKMTSVNYLMIKKSSETDAVNSNIKKRGAGAIFPFLQQDENKTLHHWHSPFIEGGPQLTFFKVFENEVFIIFQRIGISTPS
jgi:hypothetical protein